jgi:hypothetical protein
LEKSINYSERIEKWNGGFDTKIFYIEEDQGKNYIQHLSLGFFVILTRYA